MLKETIQERLKWFHPEHYQESTKQVTIRETNQEGKADVDCIVNGYAISFSFKPQWEILKNKRCADGIIFEQDTHATSATTRDENRLSLALQ